MKKKSTSQSAFFNLRVLIGLFVAVAGVFLALVGVGAFSSATAQPSRQQPSGPQPNVLRMVGPVKLDRDLRTLPDIPQEGERDEQRLTRHPLRGGQPAATFDTVKLVREAMRVPSMPAPIITFAGINSAQSGCGCFPPDTNGDVGPNHYVQSVNSRFAVYDKTGATLLAPTTFNSLFAPLTGTPCSAQNRGDPFVFYDHVADRWVVSDFAFASFPGTNFYECIAVSQTADPVAGGWFLYALPVDANNLNDYPKAAMWNNPTPGGAYHFTFNLFLNNTTFSGVKVFALDRAAMLAGQPTTAISFLIPPAGLGDSYSLVPAG